MWKSNGVWWEGYRYWDERIRSYYSCEMSRKKLNTSVDTMIISPIHFNAFAQHSRVWTASNKLNKAVELLKRSLSDDYFEINEQSACFEFANVISKSQKKVSELDRLQNLMKEKLTTTTYSENKLSLTPAPDSWSRQYCV